MFFKNETNEHEMVKNAQHITAYKNENNNYQRAKNIVIIFVCLFVSLTTVSPNIKFYFTI